MKLTIKQRWKNLKPSELTKRAIIYILAIFLVAFIIISSFASIQSRKVAKDMSTENLIKEVDAIDYAVQDYIEHLQKSVASIAVNKNIQRLLKNPNSVLLQSECQAYIENYIVNIDDAESIFIATPDTKQICHTIETQIGKLSIPNDARRAEAEGYMERIMYPTGHPYFRGLVTSPSTGIEVIVNYYPVYDYNRNELGFIGLAVKTEALKNKIAQLGYTNHQLILSFDNNHYFFSNHEEEIGSEITNEAFLKIVQKARSTNDIISGVEEGEINKQKYFIAYKSIPSYMLIAVAENTDPEMFLASKKTTQNLAIVSSIVAVVITLVSAYIVNNVNKLNKDQK